MQVSLIRFHFFFKFSKFQLSSTKDVENKTTVLHYLVDVIENKFPDLLTFSDELPHIDKAAKISTETIQKTIYQMEVNLKNVRTDITNCHNLPKDEDDEFEDVMSVSFHSYCLLN